MLLGLLQSWWTWLIGAFVVVVAQRVFRRQMADMSESRAQAAAEAESKSLQASPKHFTKEELLAYNGIDQTKPLLLAIKGHVMDVSAGSDFYGPGGPYGVFAGKDSSKAFAMMSLKEEDAHCDLTGVDENHLKVLDDWYNKLSAKYPFVGTIG